MLSKQRKLLSKTLVIISIGIVMLSLHIQQVIARDIIVDGVVTDWCSSPDWDTLPADTLTTISCIDGGYEVVWKDGIDDHIGNYWVDIGSLAITSSSSHLYFAYFLDKLQAQPNPPLLQIAIDVDTGGNNDWYDPDEVFTRTVGTQAGLAPDYLITVSPGFENAYLYEATTTPGTWTVIGPVTRGAFYPNFEVGVPWSDFACTAGCPAVSQTSLINITLMASTSYEEAPDQPEEDVLSEMTAGTYTTTPNSCTSGAGATACELTDNSSDAFIAFPPAIAMLKEADPASIIEPGGTVTFTVTLENVGLSSDPATIDSLVDDVIGDLDGQGDCSMPQSIAQGGTYSCSFTGTVSGNGDDVETNVITASGEDGDGTSFINKGQASVTLENATPSIVVTKTADPTSVSESGGSVSFTVEVQNTSLSIDPVTIDSLVDDVNGDLDGQGDCSVPQIIQSGDTYICSYTATVSGNAGDNVTNVVTASGEDDDGTPVEESDDATVTVTNTAPSIVVTKTADPTNVIEPGGNVTFSVEVENTSVSNDPVMIDSLLDDIHGNLDGQGDCSVPQTIQPSNVYSCSFTATVSGNSGDSEIDVVTASGEDDEGIPVEESDNATVIITNATPSIVVTKTVDPTNVIAPGGGVTYSVEIENTSVSSDPVTIDSLIDDINGDLDGQGDCSVPQTIHSGNTYSCSYAETVSGNPGESVTNEVTASGEDDEGTPVESSDDVTVIITDAIPSIDVTKTVKPTSVIESGGSVTFSVDVENTSESIDPVTIDALLDDVNGDLDGQGDCSLPQTIQPGDTYECSFTATISGNAGVSETNEVTASGQDDEGTSVDGRDEATVTITDATPSIMVTTTVNPAFVPGSGGVVTYSVDVENTSVSTDPVTISTLFDSIHQSLNGQGSCSTPQLIQSGHNYSCTFTSVVSGNVGESMTNEIAAAGNDDEGNYVSEFDRASVMIGYIPLYLPLIFD